ncbi:sigma-70 family RNA polymerase sigma factor [Nakamurella alba]|nr:sigma-70 family RNA polymerase sigma factor [Nakamurella alba]
MPVSSLKPSVRNAGPVVSTDSTDGQHARQARANQLVTQLADTADPSERRRLISAIAQVHRPVVRAVARRFRHRGVDPDDLEQLAWLGLLKAADRWQSGRCDDFLQYAVPTMTGEIRRYFRDHSATIRPPRPLQELRMEMNGLQGGDDHRHTPDELAALLDVPVDKVREAQKISNICYPASLDVPLAPDSDGESTYAALLGCTEDGFIGVENRLALQGFVEGLGERDRTVLHLRFVMEMSQAEIGRAIGVSQMQVSRILARVIERARAHFEDDLQRTVPGITMLAA